MKQVIEIPPEVRHIHCIGVGGSGMFPIVQILLSKGYAISGSDNNESDILALERQLGVAVTLGHSPENLKGADLVLYSAAIMADNPELMAAREAGYEAAVCFVIQMEDVRWFEPNDRTHPLFGQTLRRAAQAGVQVLAQWCRVAPDRLDMGGAVPVRL